VITRPATCTKTCNGVQTTVSEQECASNFQPCQTTSQACNICPAVGPVNPAIVQPVQPVSTGCQQYMLFASICYTLPAYSPAAINLCAGLADGQTSQCNPSVAIVQPQPVVQVTQPQQATARRPGVTYLNSGGNCYEGASFVVVPSSLCAGLAEGASTVGTRRSRHTAVAQGSPAAASTLVTALSVIGGLTVVTAMVAGWAVGIRYVVNKQVATELQRM